MQAPRQRYSPYQRCTSDPEPDFKTRIIRFFCRIRIGFGLLIFEFSDLDSDSDFGFITWLERAAKGGGKLR